jgi:hypothetical protein
MPTLEFAIKGPGPLPRELIAELHKLAGKHGLTVAVDQGALVEKGLQIRLEGPDEEELEEFRKGVEGTFRKVQETIKKMKGEKEEPKGSLDEKLVDGEVKMIEEFQCSGCVSGSDITCGRYKLWRDDENGFSCRGHVPGTFLTGIGCLLLGMPKGFNRVGDWYNYNDPNLLMKQMAEKDRKDSPTGGYDTSCVHIRLHTKEMRPPTWDKFNLAVWAMVENGYLFVRTYSPRINRTYVDVIEGGTLEMVPGAINVGEFHKDID